MSDQKTDLPLILGGGGVSRVDNRKVTGAEIAAIALSLLWLAAVIVFYAFTESDETGRTSALVKGFVISGPIVLIWATALTARTIRDLRHEARRLQVAVDAMRHSYVQQQQAAAAAARPNVERKLDEIAASAKQTETTLATFASGRAGGGRGVQGQMPLARGATALSDEQTALALGTPAEDMRPPMAMDEFIRALNFPDNPDDKEGFRCLRLALEDREAARLIRAAQDVLTLLSQDGIYMDDLRPDRAKPEVWRRFAAGERGRSVAALGGIRDRTSLALTAGRMRSDTIFRDAAHHFLRQFDRSFQALEKTASDQDLTELADTRTARVFMLFGRVTGVFD